MEGSYEIYKSIENGKQRNPPTVFYKNNIDVDNPEQNIKDKKDKQSIKKTTKKATESGKTTRINKKKAPKLKSKTLTQGYEAKAISVKETETLLPSETVQLKSTESKDKKDSSSCNKVCNVQTQTTFTESNEDPKPTYMSTGSDPIDLNNKKCVSTNTIDLLDLGETPATSEVIRIETHKHDKLLISSTESMMPSTPEGPRFSQDGTQLTYTHPGVQMEVIQKLYTFQTQGFICDVVMRVEGVDFKAHKIVLAASSPYFSDLFRKINTVRTDRLILQGLKPQSVAAMLGYFYMAKLIIDVDDVEELLDAAYYFQV